MHKFQITGQIKFVLLREVIVSVIL